MSMQMYPCPHYPAEFDPLKSLEHHLGAMHEESLPSDKFRCVTCDEKFMAQADWLNHLEDEHEVSAA